MKRKFVKVALAVFLVTLGAWVSGECLARLSLKFANFSHKSYWGSWPFWTRTKLESGDRQIKKLNWTYFYPRLEEVRLVAGGDNCNSFRSLKPFAEIENLEVLHLTGVWMDGLLDFPKLVNLEEVFISESSWYSTPWRAPTNKELDHLKSALPAIKKFEWWEDDEQSYGRIYFDAELNMFRYEQAEK